ncbi:hypothetical protein HMPREF0658_0216 [Hoylesella marshii DSM 16973 = JCM 13450]|uniref:Uncharacterized protein n=1 Tax=Hoylesella marshii DSM 16973 = JCM 13450 TaxID=862515 RepID=E0NPW5_9BACT|nr:hypothetical protein HMPREF0658_0216 [Hoylesella marshii DSM 16973 = JCM 13450]
MFVSILAHTSKKRQAVYEFLSEKFGCFYNKFYLCTRKLITV